MSTDRHGNLLPATDAAAVAAFDTALRSFSIYRGDPVADLDKAIAIAPDFAMAHIMKAHLFGLATEPAATEAAGEILATAKSLPLTGREASHVAALDLLVGGEWTAASHAFERHTQIYPHDLLALQTGHLTDFYRADARDLRDRIARVLPRWSSDMPDYGVVLGMHAFGLEETGDYRRAEEIGRRATEHDRLDCWAHHAVAHVMEMQGRPTEGLHWMMSREPYWSGDANFFKVHNWWHRALYHLELGEVKQVFALYDGPIRKDRSAVALDLVDASALLWRLHLSGHDVGERWTELAATWDAHADGRTYPFNDWHAVMAYLGAGRHDDVGRILEIYRQGEQVSAEVSGWARATALPLVEGFAAFWTGDFATAADQLWRVRHIANTFGGSHAQRDIIDWTLTEAAVRGRLPRLAEALANERLALKPHSPVNRRFLNQARAAHESGQGPM